MFVMLLYIAISFIAVKHFRRPVLLLILEEKKKMSKTLLLNYDKTHMRRTMRRIITYSFPIIVSALCFYIADLSLACC